MCCWMLTTLMSLMGCGLQLGTVVGGTESWLWSVGL